jgi:hypothetical protein
MVLLSLSALESFLKQITYYYRKAHLCVRGIPGDLLFGEFPDQEWNDHPPQVDPILERGSITHIRVGCLNDRRLLEPATARQKVATQIT